MENPCSTLGSQVGGEDFAMWPAAKHPAVAARLGNTLLLSSPGKWFRDERTPNSPPSPKDAGSVVILSDDQALPPQAIIHKPFRTGCFIMRFLLELKWEGSQPDSFLYFIYF